MTRLSSSSEFRIVRCGKFHLVIPTSFHSAKLRNGQLRVEVKEQTAVVSSWKRSRDSEIEEHSVQHIPYWNDFSPYKKKLTTKYSSPFQSQPSSPSAGTIPPALSSRHCSSKIPAPLRLRRYNASHSSHGKSSSWLYIAGIKCKHFPELWTALGPGHMAC